MILLRSFWGQIQKRTWETAALVSLDSETFDMISKCFLPKEYSSLVVFEPNLVDFVGGPCSSIRTPKSSVHILESFVPIPTSVRADP